MVDPVGEPREMGVAMSECPVCATPQQQVQLPDGGVTVDNCDKCWPPAATAEIPVPEKASAAPMPREQGTVTKEN